MKKILVHLNTFKKGNDFETTCGVRGYKKPLKYTTEEKEVTCKNCIKSMNCDK